MNINRVIKKTFEHLKEIPDWAYYIILSIIVFFIGYYLGAWTGYPKGDDVYWHLSSIKFVADNFPNIDWYPYNYSGYHLFSKYPYLSYLIIASVYKITGIELEILFEGFFFISLALFGASIFKLSRLLNIPRLDSIALSLLIFTVPAFWNLSIFGGAYIRIFTLPFIIFSIIYCIKHVDTIIERENDKIALFKVIAILSFTAYLHPRLWLFTLVTIILIYIFSIENIFSRIRVLLSVFIPVLIITSMAYMPYLTTENIGLSFNDYTLNPIYGLFTTLESTNLTLNTLYAFLSVLLAISSLILLLKYIKGAPVRYKKSNIAFLMTTSLLSLYHLFFGWFPMPKSLYIISAYNSADWLALYLTLFILASYALFKDNFGDKVNKFNIISASLTIIVILELFFVLPLVKDHFVSYTAPDDPLSITYDLNSSIGSYNDSITEGYRLGVTHRVFTRWINYVYPELDITGGRLEPLQPNKELQDWFTDRVFYRFDHRRFGKMYVDDIPKIVPEYGFLDNKSINPSLWLLDWTGSNSLIMYPDIMLNWDTLLEYLNRPQIFEIESKEMKYGNIYYFKYNNSSPIITSSNSPTVAILSNPQDKDRLFKKILMILSYINMDSKSIIPIKLDIGDIFSSKIDKFDRILVTDEQYQANKKNLIKYVENKGELLIVNKDKNNFSEYGNMVYKIENISNGRIIWINASIDDIFDAHSFRTIYDFVQLLNPLLKIENIDMSNKWNVSYITEDTSANLTHEQGSLVLEYSINPNIKHNQVNIQMPLTREFGADNQSLFTLDMYNNNWKNTYIDILFKNDTYDDGFFYYILKSKSTDEVYPINGWKTFSIPITGLRLKGHYNPILKNINNIEIIINEDKPYNYRENSVKLNNITLSSIETHAEIKRKLDYTGKNSRDITINLQNKSRGILFKETFDKNWKMSVIHDNSTDYIPVYFAGLGSMYAEIPETATYPINITFSYNEKTTN